MARLQDINLLKKLLFHFLSALSCLGLISNTDGHRHVVIGSGKVTNICVFSFRNSGLGSGFEATKTMSALSFRPTFICCCSSYCMAGFRAVLSFSIATPYTFRTVVSTNGLHPMYLLTAGGMNQTKVLLRQT